jgi:iron complex outermembrane receptor protein
MMTRRWPVLLGGTALLWVGAAQAQSVAPPPLPADDDARAPVIVTARLRQEDAQHIPGSLGVVSGALLDRSYTVNTQQLTQLVPTLNYSSANPRNTAFTIRGLGSSVVAVSQANDGLEPGVGFYVDQVYHARPATAAFDFSDIDQIEVLRGPQGTLFGKNTTAGAISITSRAPSFTSAATEELSVGNYNLVQARASATGALIGDTVAFRVSGLMTRRDGVIDNVRDGRRHNAIGNQAVKGQLLIRPSDAVQMRIIADFTNFQSDCCTQVYLRVGQSLRSAARQYPRLAAGQNYTPASLNAYDRVTDIDGPLAVDTNEGGVSSITDWTVGAVTLTSVSAWRFWNWDAENDRDYTGLPIQRSQHIPSRQDQYSQELRIASNGEGPVRYVGGLYYFYQRITGRPISIYGPAAANWLIGPSVTTGTGANQVVTPVPATLLDGYGTDGRTDFRSKSYAGFGEVNWRILPRLTATGGLRYTWEEKNGYYTSRVYGGLATTNPALVNAKLSILRPQTYAAHDSDGSLSGRANLSWQATDAVQAYASYARGFKSGGINMSGLALDANNQPALATAVVRPERNTSYEVGLKTTLFDRHLVFNIDGFYTSVRDFQATIVDSAQTVALRGYLSNIPKVTVKGIEADATAFVTPTLSLRANFAYSDGRYTDYPAGPCPLEVQASGTAACDLSGRRLASLPRFALTAGADYSLPVAALGEGGAVILHLDASSRSGFNGDPSLSRYTYIRGYTVTNGSIGVRLGSGLEVAVFARNLFDSDYIQNLTIQAGNSGLILGNPGDPRTFGLTLRSRT